VAGIARSIVREQQRCTDRVGLCRRRQMLS